MDIKGFDLVDSFRLWWAFSWRAAIWVIVINTVLMFLIGFFMIPKGEGTFASSILFASIPMFFLGIFVQIWQLKRVLPRQLERFTCHCSDDLMKDA
ncbi:hypothetical protein LQM11_005017 [Vibrio parahaemolyticus]|nr:hypothetical protein [Vibrio parahaemolyticus]